MRWDRIIIAWLLYWPVFYVLMRVGQIEFRRKCNATQKANSETKNPG